MQNISASRRSQRVEKEMLTEYGAPNTLLVKIHPDDSEIEKGAKFTLYNTFNK